MVVSQRSGRMAAISGRIRKGEISPEEGVRLRAEVQARYEDCLAHIEDHGDLPPGVPSLCKNMVSGLSEWAGPYQE